jgi:Holliday junction resolvasome RuvABC DNA-binding subunit
LPGGAARGDASRRLDTAILRAQAKTALTGLGWKPAIAHAAVDAAMAARSTEMTLERLIPAALRQCLTPRM